MSRCIVYISHQQSTPGNVLNCCILEVGRQFPSTIMFIFEEGEYTLKTILCTLWTPHFAQCVPTRWQNSVSIYLWKNWFLEKTWSHHLFLFYFFLKEKQNKKENPKCDSLFENDGSMKNRVWVRGSGYLLNGTVKTVPPL